MPPPQSATLGLHPIARQLLLISHLVVMLVVVVVVVVVVVMLVVAVAAAAVFDVVDGTLFYRKSGCTQKVISSKAERDAVLANAHMGRAEDHGIRGRITHHVSGEAMLADIEPRYKWSNMKLDIDDMVFDTLLTLMDIIYSSAKCSCCCSSSCCCVTQQVVQHDTRL